MAIRIAYITPQIYTRRKLLALTARVALAVPATSAPSERIFSFAGLLVSKKRAQLRGDNVQMLVFLRAMYQFRDRYPGIALPL